MNRRRLPVPGPARVLGHNQADRRLYMDGVGAYEITAAPCGISRDSKGRSPAAP
ncbi:hypothetical protein I547_6461 [Mycobacterium kansasii 824]|uniref:Uncharacterized protein n=1 Tax=Mycobacterium kansasii TaxID=1768 RepID=A0A1V3WI98_MYCKA|nr:hypothetical protein I547_6461 [Mycobacterium kansasii 824]OOK66713.1 hypothetical protein BZL30_8325 [Mycobacterium kansasii]